MSKTPTSFNIQEAINEEEIKNCFITMKELRPHLEETSFIEQVKRQQQNGYHLMYLKHDNNVVAILGYRILEYLAWGKILYIDDFATLNIMQGNGCGSALLSWAFTQAKENYCSEVHLDSGFTRYDAHRLYLNNGFKISSHHFSRSLL